MASFLKSENISIDDFPEEREVFDISGEGKRLDWFHKSTHCLAFLVVGTFLFMMIYNVLVSSGNEFSVPEYFISLVSVIVGFYFAKAPMFNNGN